MNRILAALFTCINANDIKTSRTSKTRMMMVILGLMSLMMTVFRHLKATWSTEESLSDWDIFIQLVSMIVCFQKDVIIFLVPAFLESCKGNNSFVFQLAVIFLCVSSIIGVIFAPFYLLQTFYRLVCRFCTSRKEKVK